jgi:transcriptional regulator with XRE-family HTH domain
MENDPYNGLVPRKAKKPRGPRPAQGARLLAFRKAAGLTQVELAELTGETQVNISFWERTDKPPRSDALPKLAKVLGVGVEDLLGIQPTPPTPASLGNFPGPVGQVQRTFEEVRRLPRRQQQRVVEIVTALIEQYRRKAS